MTTLGYYSKYKQRLQSVNELSACYHLLFYYVVHTCTLIMSVSHSPPITMTTLSMTDEEIQAYFDRNECCICKSGPRRDNTDKRAALLTHMRRSRDATHRLFMKSHYKSFVSRGGDQHDRSVTADHVRKAVADIFPDYEFIISSK